MNFKQKIYKIYFFALMVYLLPPISLVIFIVDQMTIHKTDAIFFALFLLSLLPCALIGLVLFSIGLIKSFRNKEQFNKNIGIVGVGIGGIFLLGGIFGLALMYVVLH